jgi:hypothetical protein
VGEALVAAEEEEEVLQARPLQIFKLPRIRRLYRSLSINTIGTWHGVFCVTIFSTAVLSIWQMLRPLTTQQSFCGERS